MPKRKAPLPKNSAGTGRARPSDGHVRLLDEPRQSQFGEPAVTHSRRDEPSVKTALTKRGAPSGLHTLQRTKAPSRPARAHGGRLEDEQSTDRTRGDGAFARARRRPFSAGRALLVGLLCFLIWLLLDANQLYHNALSSPFGTRRSVAISILRPIAAATNFLHISGPVNAANSALGRHPISSKLPPPPVLPAFGGGRAPNDASISAMAPRPHSQSAASAAAGAGSTRPSWPPPLRQPSKAHPLVMLSIGDSIGEDLGMGLGDLFGHDPFVKVIQRGHIDTGLARPDVYNWPAQLAEEIRQFHPGAVVMMMGANDDQALELPGERPVARGTTQWNTVYRKRLTLLMEEATASGSHVIWVGLPPLQGSAVSSAFAKTLNAMAESVAASTSGVTYVPSWKLLAGPRGQFVQYKRIDGNVEQIRYPDGVHLTPAGWDLLASSLLRPMESAWKINLHAKPLMRLG